MRPLHGRIIKAIAGFYYVHTEQGNFTCKARGVFKKRGITPRVGDFVVIDPQGMMEGIIDEVKPRKNEITRPKIANVDQVLLVFSLVNPPLSLYQIDKMLAMTSLHGFTARIALTKIDLSGATNVLETVIAIYEPLGYAIYPLDMHQHVGFAALRDGLKGVVTVLTGQSGVGKSTLLRTLSPESGAVSGDISDASHRGKHTTTTVEMYPFEQGYIADSPGFSQFDVLLEDPADLEKLFLEIRRVGQTCTYRGCLHEQEQGCAVVSAVANGTITQSRYDSYVQMLQAIKEWKARRY